MKRFRSRAHIGRTDGMRAAHGGAFTLVEMLTVFKQANLSADPDYRGIPDRLVSLRYHEIARATLRKVDIPHGLERYPNQEIHALRPWFQHGLNDNVRRDFVRVAATRDPYGENRDDEDGQHKRYILSRFLSHRF